MQCAINTYKVNVCSRINKSGSNSVNITWIYMLKLNFILSHTKRSSYESIFHASLMWSVTLCSVAIVYIHQEGLKIHCVCLFTSPHQKLHNVYVKWIPRLRQDHTPWSVYSRLVSWLCSRHVIAGELRHSKTYNLIHL